MASSPKSVLGPRSHTWFLWAPVPWNCVKTDYESKAGPTLKTWTSPDSIMYIQSPAVPSEMISCFAGITFLLIASVIFAFWALKDTSSFQSCLRRQKQTFIETSHKGICRNRDSDSFFLRVRFGDLRHCNAAAFCFRRNGQISRLLIVCRDGLSRVRASKGVQALENSLMKNL